MSVRRPAGAAVVAAAALLCLSGCGEKKADIALGGDASESASPSASVSPSESASATPVPDPPTATENTRAGREAMARWFVAAASHAYATNDASAIEDVGSAEYGCGECDRLARYLEGQQAKGLHLEPADIPAQSVTETARLRPNAWVVTVVTPLSRRADVDASGASVRTYKAKPALTYQIGVSWEKNTYRITGWKTASLR